MAEGRLRYSDLPDKEGTQGRPQMKNSIGLVSGALLALALATAPALSIAQSTTVTCTDGTTSTAGKGACSHHGGVNKSAAPAGGAAAAPAAAPAAPAAAATPAAKSSPTSTQAAPGGGPGMVWVNTDSKVYHCQGDQWYGKTKSGQYMTESAAKAGGNRPSNNKPCS